MTDGYNGATLSEIIDLSCSGYHRCPDWVDYPLDVFGATGGLLEHVPLICGGYSNSEYFDECYKVTANRAVLIGTMLSKRYGAASVVINHSTLWVTGGYNEYFHQCYKVTANRAVLIGIMSSRRYNAASVVINHSTLWVTGGYPDTYGSWFLASTEFINLDGTFSMGNSGWRHLFYLNGCLPGRKLVSH